MTDIHEKPIYNDEFVEIRPFFEDDEIDYYHDDEPPEYSEGSWDDGYPDELIPEHAFTSSEEEDYYYDYSF